MGELISFIAGFVLMLAWHRFFPIRRKPLKQERRGLNHVMGRVIDQHRIMTNDPLVIRFSHWRARDEFVREIEASVGMPSGELVRSGAIPMYDGVELRADDSVRDREHDRHSSSRARFVPISDGEWRN